MFSWPWSRLAAWGGQRGASIHLSPPFQDRSPKWSMRSACVCSIAVAKASSRLKYGRALLACAAAVFDELRQGVKSIEFLADPTIGEIRVAGNEYIIAGLIATVFSRLRQQYPGIAIDVAPVGVISEQHRALRERKVDLVVGRIGQSHEEDIDTEVLFNDRITVVAGLENPWSRRRKVHLSELADEPWVLPRLTLLSGCSLPSYSVSAASHLHREAWREARFIWSAR